MINLSSFLVQLSAKYGYEVFLDERGDGEDQSRLITFKFQEGREYFSLKMIRNWRSTEVQFVPGPFANQSVSFLCEQIFQNKSLIQNVLSMNKSSYSDFSLKIDDIDYDKIGEFKNGPHKLDFYIDVLTTDSSLSHGLLNQEESDLLDTAVSLFVALLPKSSIPYTNPDEVLGYPEGATSQVLVNRYERDPRNRAKAIAIHGHKCLACGFDFSQSYGDLGTDFIIVHHIVPISKISPDYIVDPEKDLVTLCANCHSMIHRKDPPLSLEELRSIVSKSD